MFRKRAVPSSLMMLLAASGLGAQSTDGPWFASVDIQGLLSTYSGTTARDTLHNFGVFIHGDYLERAGVTFGYNRTALGFADDDRDIAQDSLFLSGRWTTTPDWASGRVTWRLDGHVISNDDASGETDDVTAVAPQVSYLNYARTLYVDLGFATTSYGDGGLASGSLDIDQWTPTLGFGFNEQRDWVQLRAYLIEPSSPGRARGEEDTAALELKWTHWPAGWRLLGMDSVRTSVMLGERIFAVDPDAGGVYNLSDLQTGGVSLGGEWALSERDRLLLLIGVEEYENGDIAEAYRNSFVYLSFSHRWH
jgi:hypothetical protein